MDRLDAANEALGTAIARAQTFRRRVFVQTSLRSNTRVAANALPPETLASIFEIARGECSCWLSATENRQRCEQHTSTWKHWIRITEVCRQWREVALDDCLLWNKIYIEKQCTKRVLRCLRRAGDAPLDITISDYDTLPHPIRVELAQRYSQLRRLTIQDVAHSFDELASLIRSTSAPLLERLDLVNSDQERRRRGRLPLMFADHTPRLRSLFLSGMATLPLVQTSHLTHLHFSDQRMRTLDDFIDLLGANRELESLVLSKCNLAQNPQSQSADPTHLPTLRRLAFNQCEANLVRGVLTRTVLPRDDLAVVLDRWLPANLSLAEVIPPRVANAPPFQADVLGLQLYPHPYVVVLAAAKSSAFRLSYPFRGRLPQELLPDLGMPPSMPRSAVRELKLFTGRHDIKFLRKVLAYMPCLTKVILEEPTTEILSAFVPDAVVPGMSYPAPALDTLIIMPDPIWYERYADALQEMAKGRDHGHRLRHLYIGDTQAFWTRRRWKPEVWSALKQSLEPFVDDVRIDQFPTDSWADIADLAGIAEPASSRAWIHRDFANGGRWQRRRVL